MFYNTILSLVSFATYLGLFAGTSGALPTLLTFALFIVGRVDPGQAFDSVMGHFPAMVLKFIDLKVYGFAMGVIGTLAVRVASRFHLRAATTHTSLVLVSALILSGMLCLANLAWVWVFLAVPFSFCLALLVVFGPLLIIFNVVVIYRVFVTFFLYWCGVRDPWIDPGILFSLFRSLTRVLGARGLTVISGWGTFLDIILFGPLDLFLVVVRFLFLPSSLAGLLGGPRLVVGSRIGWSVSFFLLSFLDFEFIILFILGSGVALMFWGFFMIKSVFGIDTIFDFLFPQVIIWIGQGCGIAGFTVSDGFVWLLGGLIQHQGLRFPYVDESGEAREVGDREGLFNCPPTVRRDIILGYTSFYGIGRFFGGLVVIFFLGSISYLVMLPTFFRHRARGIVSGIFRGLAFAMIPWMVPDAWVSILDEFFLRSEMVWGPLWIVLKEDGYKWVRFFWAVLGWVHTVSSRVPDLDFELPKDRPRLSTLFFSHFLSLTRRSTLRFVEALNDVKLPEFVSNQYEPPSVEGITRAFLMLQDVGFPVTRQTLDELINLNIPTDVTGSSYLAEHAGWRKWFLGKINIGLGYPKLKVGKHPWLPSEFFEAFPGYLHVASWTGEEPEVRSTARYWTGNEAQKIPHDLEEPLLDDLWSAVNAQYKHSRLATFHEVYSGWVKRYNMGFGFLKEVNGKRKQLTRNEVIKMMGGKWKFLEAWERVFNRGLGLHQPAPVFAKYESLKAKKALEKSVRTILGSPFIHHVMTTVFNYHPNHNYKVWETPMKVGMPINGQNYNRLWESLMRHDKVWAGDMTAFDSSQSPAMLRICAAIRKEGYSLHKDRSKICELIDVSYEALIQQPLGFKNLGDLAWKNQGATTGHSSTSNDNSIMLVANYLFAWRRVTGLRAREFFNYNTLANFGDDHVLGYDPVFGWCPERMIAAMAELGTIMRDEAPGETKLPALGQDFNKLNFAFLAKVPVPLSPRVKQELMAAGVDVPLTYATAHVRSRLLGKMKGENLVGKVKDPQRSYLALISYLHMTAHHQDIYRDLVHEAHIFYQNHKELWTRQGLIGKDGRKDRLPAPPTYNAVLRQWYAKEPFPWTDDGEEADPDVLMYVHLQDDILGIVVRWIADVPTLLSPRYLNTRWADWLQTKLAWALSWPIHLIALSNGSVGDHPGTRVLLAKTPYAFLRGDALMTVGSESYGVLLTRHWLFFALSRALSVRRSLSILDFVRLGDAAWANLVYILTGRVTMAVIELDLHVVDTLLVLALSYINLDLGLPPLDFDLLSPSLIVARASSALLRLITPSGSIDYQPLDEQVRHLVQSSTASFILNAPTGTGKSTRMMARILSRLPPSLKLVVIEPRHLVTKGVGEYMRELYPHTGIGISTEGYELKGDERLIYSTAQSFLMNKTLRVNRNIVLVLDEAHLDEPHYEVMRKLMTVTPTIRRIFTTATPTESILSLGLTRLDLPAVNQNVIHEIDHEIASFRAYKRWCTMFANDRLPYEKVLIFCPSIVGCHEIASTIYHKVCILNSKQAEVDPTASVYISTSVADAGITLPDVGFVLSMDYDIKVTVPDVDARVGGRADEDGIHFYAKDGWQPRPYFHRLSEATRMQRRGRTGRTLDGVFHYFRVADVVVEEVEYTLSDFANGLAPASAFAVRWFPQTPVRAVPLFVPFMTIWDRLPRTDWTRFKAWSDEFQRVSADRTPKAFLAWLQVNFERIKTTTASGQMTVLDADELPEPWGRQTQPGVKPVESEVGLYEGPLPPPGALAWLPPTTPVARQDVSGAGLLCGVRCCLGLIWTFTSERPSFDEVYARVIACTDETLVDPLRNYHATPLLEALWTGWRIRARVEFDDGTDPILPSPRYDPLLAVGPPCVLYQSLNHYNYLGHPIPPRFLTE